MYKIISLDYPKVFSDIIKRNNVHAKLDGLERFFTHLIHFSDESQIHHYLGTLHACKQVKNPDKLLTSLACQFASHLPEFAAQCLYHITYPINRILVLAQIEQNQIEPDTTTTIQTLFKHEIDLYLSNTTDHIEAEKELIIGLKTILEQKERESAITDFTPPHSVVPSRTISPENPLHNYH